MAGEGAGAGREHEERRIGKKNTDAREIMGVLLLMLLLLLLVQLPQQHLSCPHRAILQLRKRHALIIASAHNRYIERPLVCSGCEQMRQRRGQRRGIESVQHDGGHGWGCTGAWGVVLASFAAAATTGQSDSASIRTVH
jgi:hypothetical protein